MAGKGGESPLASLLGELFHRGGITITTPEPQKLEEKTELDLVTVVQLDGSVIMHVSARLLADRARRDRCVAEHLARVTLALAPLTDLRRVGQTFQRVFWAALLLVPQMGWMMNTWHILHTDGDLKSRTSFMLFGLGVVGAPLGYWVRGYAARLFNRALRFWLRRALPTEATKLLTAGRG